MKKATAAWCNALYVSVAITNTIVVIFDSKQKLSKHLPAQGYLLQ